MSRIGTIDIIQNSQNVANNTSSITVKGIIITTGESYRGDHRTGTYTIKQGSTVLKSGSFTHGAPANSTTTLFSVTLTVTHDSNGNSGTISASYNYDSGWASGTASKTLTTIPRKSTLSVGNGTLNSAQTLTVTRQSTSFTHTITAKCGSASTTICTKSTSTSISFTPPLSWASQNTTGVSLSVTYTITTYNGNTSVGSNSYTKTCAIPSSVKPSVTFSITEASGLQWGVYIQDVSKLSISLTPTTSYGSAIASYKTTVDGKTYTSSSFTTGILSSYGELTITATVTDKRGRTGTYSQKISVQEYKSPVFNTFKIHRCNADGTENMQGEYGQISFDCTCSALYDANGISNNEVSFIFEYKKTNENQYVLYDTLGYGIIGGSTGTLTTVFPAESGSSYNVRVTAQDAFKSSIQTTVLSTAFATMHVHPSGRGISFGKLAELEDVLDIGFQTRMMGGIIHPVLEAETDLNTVFIPNTYVGANISNYNYLNCPITSGTFTLEVIGAGKEGQVKQRIQTCNKTQSKVYERYYYSNAWGDWICTSDWDGTLLWSGGYYMTASHTAPLSEPISKQKSGIVLVFSYYESGMKNTDFHSFFIPKRIVSLHEGGGHNFLMMVDKWNKVCRKYLYIFNNEIKGHDTNGERGTASGSGITYDNTSFVLRYVIGV